MEAVYLMGRDVWGDGCTKTEYLRQCRESRKYRRGRWHVLADSDGALMCSVIAYLLPRLAGRVTLGLGSVATPLALRGRGYASQALKCLMSGYRQYCRVEVFLLFADIELRFYQRLGFMPLPEAVQSYGDAVGMAYCAPDLWEEILRAAAEQPPGYF
ncbi:putative GNAT family N-acyltransferase [Chromobacterium alkanivorans]|nr:GNAT family N-acetyltransferase [Chromobacterium alkanivorans]MCS3804976.1 putative GNAT family N-acyltransferase [Chromobacterium alkanivorans]MCS3819461.1 putative GNAT family N-acyltransferase [Chromobacterium alkanivorans]MCS3873973.1 putative GNAT family N-acyltransferase [Chromobacterium alkanivorans]